MPRSRRRRQGGSSGLTPVVARRNIEVEGVPVGGGVEGFDTEPAREINVARLAHLERMQLPMDGRSVLEVGAGVGHLSQFFVARGCRVVATEAREANVERMKALYPTLDARLANVEDDLTRFGRFDVVFCYGLLYHLENPVRALRNMAVVCDDLLLVETVITDADQPVLQLADETLSNTQALRGIAHRPSPAYVALALNRIGFDHVYTPLEAPEHPDYRFDAKGDFAFSRDGYLLRQIFVASRQRLDDGRFAPLLEE